MVEEKKSFNVHGGSISAGVVEFTDHVLCINVFEIVFYILSYVKEKRERTTVLPLDPLCNQDRHNDNVCVGMNEGLFVLDLSHKVLCKLEIWNFLNKIWN